MTWPVSFVSRKNAISPDWIVRFANQFYQLQPARQAQVGKGKVRVRRYLNGELHFSYAAKDLAYTRLPERPKAKTVDKVKSKTGAVAVVSLSTMCRQPNRCGAVSLSARDRLGLAEPRAIDD